MNLSIIGIGIMAAIFYIACFMFFTEKITDYFDGKYGFEAYEKSLICCVFGWFFLTGLAFYLIG
jgi:hypothetical protein